MAESVDCILRACPSVKVLTATRAVGLFSYNKYGKIGRQALPRSPPHADPVYAGASGRADADGTHAGPSGSVTTHMLSTYARTSL